MVEVFVRDGDVIAVQQGSLVKVGVRWELVPRGLECALR